MTTATTSRGHGAPAFVTLLNPIVSRLLRQGARFGPNVLLTVRGRKTGEPHTFPVALIERDDRRFVMSAYGEVQWVRNLRAVGEATLPGRSRNQDFRAVELPPEEATEVLRAAFAPYASSRFAMAFARRYFGVSPDTSPSEFLDVARAHPTFELLPKER